MRSVLLVLLYAITSATVASYAQGGKTYCNPLDLNYQYNFEQRGSDPGQVLTSSPRSGICLP